MPRLEIDGEVLWQGDGTDQVSVDFDGRVLLHRTAAQAPTRVPLFAARVVPTAEEDKNWNPAVHDVYPRLAAALMRDLEIPAMHRIGDGHP